MKKLNAHDIQQYRTILLFTCTIGVWFVFHVFFTNGVLFTPRNLSALTVQMTVTTILAVGMTWLLVAREIDLSVGATLSLVMVVTFQMFLQGQGSLLLVIPAVLVLGTIVGILQGAVRVFIGVPSFVVTLAGFSWIRGASYIISDGQTRSGAPDAYYAISNSFISPGFSVGLVAIMAVYIIFRLLRSRRQMQDSGPVRLSLLLLIAFATVMACVMAWAFYSWRGMPYPVILMAAVVLLSDWISRDTTFGMYIYAIGGNPEAARRSGIPVPVITLGLFAIMGFLAGVAATVQGSLLDAAPPNIGELLALSAISAAVIGGTNLFGGYGSIPGTVGGALLMASIANGLSLAGVNTFYQMVATGLILVVAVSIDSITRKRSQERVS
jgi:D-xylose transport system permease protein